MNRGDVVSVWGWGWGCEWAGGHVAMSLGKKITNYLLLALKPPNKTPNILPFPSSFKHGSTVCH